MHFDEALLRDYYAQAPEDIALDDIDLSRIPSHITIIMDGNGRWAQAQGLERTQGHIAGIDSLRETVSACVHLGVDVLSVYAFSTENWRRPKHEVDLLMHLFATTLLQEMPLFHRENVRLRFLGDISALPKRTYDVLQQGVLDTASHTGLTMAMAINYGARAEITRACQLIAREVAEGRLGVDDIDQSLVDAQLYTAGLPDPELLIRTSGELRLSNYLLWQLAYTEFYVTDTLWPDFDRWELLRALRAYQHRNRRFGGVVAS